MQASYLYFYFQHVCQLKKPLTSLQNYSREMYVWGWSPRLLKFNFTSHLWKPQQQLTRPQPCPVTERQAGRPPHRPASCDRHTPRLGTHLTAGATLPRCHLHSPLACMEGWSSSPALLPGAVFTPGTPTTPAQPAPCPGLISSPSSGSSHPSGSQQISPSSLHFTPNSWRAGEGWRN